jgi:ABC-type nitrate/sulfonate/bicarbonate transport system permease component
MPSYQRWGFRLVPIIAFLALWEWYGVTHESLLFPSFTETMQSLIALIQTPELWNSIWLSHQAMILGFLSALVVGIPIGVLAGYSRVFDNALEPYIRLMIVIPKSALVPIFILALGIGVVARAWVIFLYVVVYIIVNVRTGVRQVDDNLLEMAHSFGASRFHIWTKILLPGAYPALVAGLRIGLGRAMSGMITVELLLSAVGIGRLIMRFRGEFDAGSAYAVVLVVLIEALLLSSGLRWLERRLTHWAQ